MPGRYLRLVVENNVLRREVTGLNDLAVGEALGGGDRFAPVHRGRRQDREPRLHDLLRLLRRRQRVLDDAVEAAEQGSVEHCRVVRCPDDEAVGVVLFEENKERVQDAAHLADVAAGRPIDTDSVELVENQVEGLAVDDLQLALRPGGECRELKLEQPD